jgi:hypothetical protein
MNTNSMLTEIMNEIKLTETSMFHAGATQK